MTASRHHASIAWSHYSTGGFIIEQVTATTRSAIKAASYFEDHFLDNLLAGRTEEQARDLLARIQTATAWHDDTDDPREQKEDIHEAMQEWLDDNPRPGDDEPTDEPGDEPDDEQPEPEQQEEETTVETAVSPGEKFDLERHIVNTTKAHRDEILDGIDLGGTKNVTHTISLPDLPEVTFDHAHEKLPLLVKTVGLRRPVMLVGPAGSGKTTAGKQLAEAYGVPFYANSNSPMDTRTLAFGYMDGGGNYRPGYLYSAMKYGGVLLDDEVDSSNPAVMVSKNAAIENRFAYFPNGEKVEAHENFFYIGSANTYGRGADRMYVGRTQLDAATLNRFIFIEWNYDETLETMLAGHASWTDHVQRVRAAVAEHKMRYVVSPRQSIAGSELLAADVPWQDVEQMVLYPGWAEEDIDKVRRSL